MVQRRWFRTLLWLLFGIALLTFLAHFLIYVRYAAALFQFPFDYDQGEGFELNDTVLFARGEWPYRDNATYPFYASNYPPLYHLLLVPFVWLFGPALWYGRLLSFLATLLTAAAIGYAVWRDGPRGRWSGGFALLSGLAFLASNYVYHIGPLFRQHMTMVMLETLAMLTLYPLKRADDPDADPRQDRRRIILALGLLLAAGFTKQLAYATAIVAVVFIAGKGLGRAVKAGAVFGLVGLALFGMLNVLTRGHWWTNIVLANVNEFVPGQMQGLFRQWYDLHAVILWAAIAWVVYELKRRRWSLYVLWLLGAVANSTLSGKWGAGESYFTTAIAATCLCSGLAFAHLWQAARRRATAAGALVLLIVPLLYIVQAGRLLHLPTQGRLFGRVARVLALPADSPYFDSQGYTQLGRPPNAIDVAQGFRLLRYVQAAPGPVLTEEAMFSLLAGKEVVTNPTQLLNLQKKGLLDTRGLVDMIASQQFDVIVLKAHFYPKDVLQVIGQVYEPVATEPLNGFNYTVLVPKE